LRLAGELDIASVGVLEGRLAGLGRDSESVILDLSGLEFIDSLGLHALIRAMEAASKDGWRLQIDRNVPPQAMRGFELGHFERLTPGYDSSPPPCPQHLHHQVLTVRQNMRLCHASVCSRLSQTSVGSCPRTR